MLDLTLQHLDIDVGEAGEEVGVVVRACGESECYVCMLRFFFVFLELIGETALMQLEAYRTPKDKASVLVAAHKVLVGAFLRFAPLLFVGITHRIDGLSKLPPITRKRKGEIHRTFAIWRRVESTSHKADDDEPSISLNSSSISSSTSASKPTSTPVSGDLLPFLIFSVVKSNPSHLVSHLLFTQRFCNQVWVESRSTGEEGYCLINLMAVAEFLENVDLAALGLAVVPVLGQEEEEEEGGSRPGLSPVGLSPILGVREGGGRGVEVGLRGRVEQQVDAIAGSANKVLAGVMDTSFGMLKSLLPGQEAQVSGVNSTVGSATVSAATAVPATTTTTINATTGSAPWNVVRPNFGLLRHESGFSIASIAASLPQAITSRKLGSRGDHREGGQQMVTASTSRPFSELDAADAYAFGHGEAEGGGDVRVDLAGGSVVEDGEEEEEEEEEESKGGEGGGEDGEEPELSVRSIRSFESMMSERGGKKRARKAREVANVSLTTTVRTTGSGPRKSLSDQLVHMSALAGIKVSV
jgi:hypothetical protein